jgi:hypothetical protein
MHSVIVAVACSTVHRCCFRLLQGLTHCGQLAVTAPGEPSMAVLVSGDVLRSTTQWSSISELLQYVMITRCTRVPNLAMVHGPMGASWQQGTCAPASYRRNQDASTSTCNTGPFLLDSKQIQCTALPSWFYTPGLLLDRYRLLNVTLHVVKNSSLAAQTRQYKCILLNNK